MPSSSSTLSSSCNTSKLAVAGASILALTILMRLRRKSKNNKNGNTKKKTHTAASIAERGAFPVALTKEVREMLGLEIGDAVPFPPRLVTAMINGMPIEATNPIASAYVVVDAVSPADEDGTALFAAVEEAAASSSPSAEAFVGLVASYIIKSCPFLHGAEHTAASCSLVKGCATATVSLSPSAAPSPASPSASSDVQSKQKKKAVSEAAAVGPVPLQFPFLVAGAEGLRVYVALVPEARSVVSLVLVPRGASSSSSNTNDEQSTTTTTAVATAAQPQPEPFPNVPTCTASDASDFADISAVLTSGLVLLRAPMERLCELAKGGSSTTTIHVAETEAAPSSSSASPHPHHHHDVITSASMRFRAVLPTADATVEDVRFPLVAGTEEVLLTISTPPNNYARVTYHPALPSTWEDERAITDPAEKEDEFKRNVMRHFFGYASNSITLHPADVSGRGCLWFGEERAGAGAEEGATCCRTYVCPNFDMGGRTISKKKSSEPKGFTVIRWEGPAATWEESQKCLISFLDYFQFQ